LRHTNATLRSLTGRSVDVGSMRLGHSTVKITLDRYVHPDSVANRAAADTLPRLCEGPM
jgi:integrase